MKTKSSIPGLLTFLHSLLLLSLSDSYKEFIDLGDSSIVFTYKRVAEIEQHCSPFLSLASKLNPDDHRGYRLRKELSFVNGDWEQGNGGFPLMPFDESDWPWSSLPQTAPLKLVSFQVKDISSVHFENSVSIGGTMSIGITKNDSYLGILQSSPFYMRPGLSVLTIVFEGVYLESEESGGERLLCLLGNTTLPLSEPHGDHWDLGNTHVPDYNLFQDDQILLILRYPQTFNLTRRAVKGEMRSLNGGNLKNFDDVHISSQLSHYSKYQFSSDLMSRSCDVHPYQEEMREDGVNAFNGSEFCKALQHVSENAFNLFPNYKFCDRDGQQSKLGPFQPKKEINSAKSWWDYEDFKLVMQHLMCKEEGTNARISAVFRLFPASIPVHTARSRTGLSSITLSAEGTWDSSSGVLCMIGCPVAGVVDLGLEQCNSEISLYFPQVFSIKQRSIILGSITSITEEGGQFLPLLFDCSRYPLDLLTSLGLHNASYSSYNYSKIKQVTEIRDRNQPSQAFTLLKQIFLKYPSPEDGLDTLAQLNHPFTNLNFHSRALCHQSSDLYYSKVFIQMEILYLGPFFGRNISRLYYNNQAKTPVGTERQRLTNSQLLNISVNFIYDYLTERPTIFAARNYRDFSPLFLEGVYDPLAGDMHLIGCRKVRDGSVNLERGFDCLVEAKVHYPSETGRWLKNPSVEITISSQRKEDDPLHFSPLTFTTSIIPYEKHRHDVAFRKHFEEVLRILISLLAVGIIFSQLLYMNKNADFIPHISLSMLAQQILGYIAELTRASEILLESKEFVSSKNQPYDLNEYKLLIKTLNFLARFLVLFALLITTRLYQKVSEARNKPNAYGPNKPKRIPHYKHVILTNLKIHISVCLVLLGLRYIEIFLRNDLRLTDAFVLPGILMRQVETQVLWAQGFFLFPQIVENSLWQFQVKPLRKLYYVGLTLLRLILCFYDYIRDPVSEPYTSEGVFNQVDSDFLSISGIITAPLIMIVLAFIVHIQQSLNCLKSAGHQVQNP